MNPNKKPLYLIDSYGLIYRSYFAFMSRPLRNTQGQNISALFGFARTLISLIDDGAPAAGTDGSLLAKPVRPYCLAAVFDSRSPTFRHKEYPEYKANRQKAPDDLHAQVPLVEEMLTALGVPSFQLEGYEADDIIATLSLILAGCATPERVTYVPTECPKIPPPPTVVMEPLPEQDFQIQLRNFFLISPTPPIRLNAN